MPAETVLVPGARHVEATLDTTDTDTDACVVAAPPHPQAGGHRGDRRLTAVSDYLTDHGIDCLRFDYGEWDDGHGEREDARNAVRWGADEYEHVALFGYSFGASTSLLAAADSPVSLAALSVLAPQSRFDPGLDAAGAVADIDCPLQVVVGVRDETVDWEPVVEAAREHDATVVEMASDHHFVGQDAKVAETCGEFLRGHLV